MRFLDLNLKKLLKIMLNFEILVCFKNQERAKNTPKRLKIGCLDF